MNNNDLLIKVPEKEFEGLLHREQVLSDVKEHLSQWTALMRDVVNYGTNLIPRCFGTSSHSLGAAVVLGVFLRQFVAMLDGAEVLLSNGAVHAAKLQMRGLFEAAVCIEWLLLGDSEKKAEYYYVHNLRRMRLSAEKVQGNSAAGREFIATMNTMGLPMNQEASDAAKQQVPEIDRVLAQPEFGKINADFEAQRKGNWYSPLGPKNLREMAKTVGRLGEYILMYSTASEVMHGSNYRQHVSFAKGRITFQPIRYLEEFSWVYRYSVTTAFSTYRLTLKNYRPGEIATFNRKYMEKWRNAFMNIPKIVINPIETTI